MNRASTILAGRPGPSSSRSILSPWHNALIEDLNGLPAGSILERYQANADLIWAAEDAIMASYHNAPPDLEASEINAMYAREPLTSTHQRAWFHPEHNVWLGRLCGISAKDVLKIYQADPTIQGLVAEINEAAALPQHGNLDLTLPRLYGPPQGPPLRRVPRVRPVRPERRNGTARREESSGPSPRARIAPPQEPSNDEESEDEDFTATEDEGSDLEDLPDADLVEPLEDESAATSEAEEEGESDDEFEEFAYETAISDDATGDEDVVSIRSPFATAVSQNNSIFSQPRFTAENRRSVVSSKSPKSLFKGKSLFGGVFDTPYVPSTPLPRTVTMSKWVPSKTKRAFVSPSSARYPAPNLFAARAPPNTASKSSKSPKSLFEGIFDTPYVQTPPLPRTVTMSKWASLPQGSPSPARYPDLLPFGARAPQYPQYIHNGVFANTPLYANKPLAPKSRANQSSTLDRTWSVQAQEYQRARLAKMQAENERRKSVIQAARRQSPVTPSFSAEVETESEDEYLSDAVFEGFRDDKVKKAESVKQVKSPAAKPKSPVAKAKTSNASRRPSAVQKVRKPSTPVRRPSTPGGPAKRTRSRTQAKAAKK